MNKRNTSWRSNLIQTGQVLALLVITVGLWIGFISVFGPDGIVGSRLIRAGFGLATVLDVLNVSGFIGLLIVTMALRRKTLGPVLVELGIRPFSWRAIATTLLVLCISVALLYVLGYRPHFGSPNALIAANVIGPFIEETLFRGFLFLQFRRWIGLPFWLAAVVASVPFALEHTYQGTSITLLIEVLAVTFSGGILFCWLVERWGNLWAAWTLHAGLNFTFAIFALGTTAADNRVGNEQRLLVVVLVIAATLMLTRRRATVAVKV